MIKLLWKNIVIRRNKWIGNIMWHEGLPKPIIEGTRHQGCNSYVEMKRKENKR